MSIENVNTNSNVPFFTSVNINSVFTSTRQFGINLGSFSRIPNASLITGVSITMNSLSIVGAPANFISGAVIYTSDNGNVNKTIANLSTNDISGYAGAVGGSTNGEKKLNSLFVYTGITTLYLGVYFNAALAADMVNIPVDIQLTYIPPQ